MQLELREKNTKHMISIVIPCYRSEDTIERVVDEIEQEFQKKTEFDHEIILVNDGSPDNTFRVIQSICKRNKYVTGLDLSKNFGQGSALMAGIQYVHGDIMVNMDDDGQHPAYGIFPLVEKILEGWDIVYAYFPQKKHSFFKRITSSLNSWMQKSLGNRGKGYHVTSFAAFSSFSIQAIKKSGSPVVAIDTYINKITKRVTDIPMEHRARLEGKSNYSLANLFRLWRRSVTSFSTRLLDLSIYAGGICALASFVYAMATLIRKLLNPQMALGYASTMIVILFLSGVLMLLIGILGDYIGKIFLILVRLPNYYIRHEILNCYSRTEESKDLVQRPVKKTENF